MRIQISHVSRETGQREILGNLWTAADDRIVQAEWFEGSGMIRKSLERNGVRADGRTYHGTEGDDFLDAVIRANTVSQVISVIEVDDQDVELKKKRGKVKRDKGGRFAGGEAGPKAKSEDTKTRKPAAKDAAAKSKGVAKREKSQISAKKVRDSARKSRDASKDKTASRITNHRDAAVSSKKSTRAVGKADLTKQVKVDIDAGQKRAWQSGNGPLGEKDESWKGHFDKHPDEGGAPSKERKEAVHDPIVDKFSNHVKPVAPGQPKIAILTMGGPASGKSTALADIDKSGFVEAEPDAVKSMLPDFRAGTGGDDPSNPKNKTYEGAAMQVHEESSYIAKRIRDKAIVDGKNVIIDGTGKNADAYVGIIKELKEKGYKVSVRMTNIPTDVALKRNAKRAQKNGRLVPPRFVKDAYVKIPRNTWSVATVADDFELHDTNREQGSNTKVYSTDAGKQTVHDSAFYNAYRKDNGGPSESVDLAYERSSVLAAAPLKLPNVNPADFAPVINMVDISNGMQEAIWKAFAEDVAFDKAVEDGTAGPLFDLDEGILEGIDPDLGDDMMRP